MTAADIVAPACGAAGISDATYYNWRRRFPYTFRLMATWPKRIPPDLAGRLGDVRSRRSRGSEQDQRGKIVERLEIHWVEAPAVLPCDPSPETVQEI